MQTLTLADDRLEAFGNSPAAYTGPCANVGGRRRRGPRNHAARAAQPAAPIHAGRHVDVGAPTRPGNSALNAHFVSQGADS